MLDTLLINKKIYLFLTIFVLYLINVYYSFIAFRLDE